MYDYGMSFLHDLDLDRHCIGEIPAVDPDDCKAAMSWDGKVPKPLIVVQRPNSEPTGLYPLGEMPTWSEVKTFIGHNAGVFMDEWVWDPEWEEENLMAAQLFVQFTREYFATLKTDALRADAPSPICLQDAMKAWTVDEITTTLVSCWFAASNHGLKGRFSGARSLSFREHARAFFPPDSESYKESAWKPFLQHGYMRDYFWRLGELDDEDTEALMNAIHNIFGRLHCLPVIVAPSLRSKGKVWTASHEGIHLVTNPIFYKVKGIGSVFRALTGSSGRLPRVKASNEVISRWLMEMRGEGENAATERRWARRLAKVRMARLSRKTKNRRQPPGGRKKQKAPSLPEESESEEETDSDDNEVDQLEDDEEEIEDE
jgi:hypothetical protein